MTALDEQVGGSHYRDMVIQPWIFNIMNDIPSTEAHIIEYICRWRKKGGILDLKKIQQYCQMLIDHEEILNDLKSMTCDKCIKKHSLARSFDFAYFNCKCECHAESSDAYAQDFMDRVKEENLKNIACVSCRNVFGVCAFGEYCKCECHKETKKCLDCDAERPRGYIFCDKCKGG